MVRLDPDRALSQRLRDQIAVWSARPFHLLAAHAGTICLLRQLEVPVERPPVARQQADREAEPIWVDAEDALADIETLVAVALEDGFDTLAEVTARVLTTLPDDVHYVAAGRIAAALAQLTRMHSGRERPWQVVHERLEVEDWKVRTQREME